MWTLSLKKDKKNANKVLNYFDNQSIALHCSSKPILIFVAALSLFKKWSNIRTTAHYK